MKRLQQELSIGVWVDNSQILAPKAVPGDLGSTGLCFFDFSCVNRLCTLTWLSLTWEYTTRCFHPFLPFWFEFRVVIIPSHLSRIFLRNSVVPWHNFLNALTPLFILRWTLKHKRVWCESSHASLKSMWRVSQGPGKCVIKVRCAKNAKKLTCLKTMCLVLFFGYCLKTMERNQNLVTTRNSSGGIPVGYWNSCI